MMTSRSQEALPRRRFTRPGKARGSVSIVLTAISVVLLLVGVLAPHRGGGKLPVLYLLVAFHSLFMVGVTAFTLLAVIVVAALRWRWVTIVIALIALVASVSVMVPSLNRSPRVEPARVASSGAGTLRVLEWNTGEQDVDTTVLQTLIKQTDPNIIVLPEYFTQLAKGTLADVAKQRDMQILGWNGSSATALISRSLGNYRVNHSGTPPWAGFVAVPANPQSPRLVITHLQRPSLTSTSLWREHVEWAAAQCQQGTIAVGDFNATAPNINPSTKLGKCSDSAAALGESPQGTWPTALPGSLGATIDHVFVGPGWKAAAFSVLDGLDEAGSDHRPTFAVVTPARRT